MSKGAIIGLSVGVVAIIVIIFMFMGGGWSEEDKKAYMDVCMMGGNEAFCECSLDYIMDEYPNAADMEDDPAGAFQVGVDAGTACMDKLY